jgi:hypothetical protein
LYVTDENNKLIEFPSNFSIYTPDPELEGVTITVDPIHNVCSLLDSEEYFIYYDNKNILNLFPQRTWSIDIK